jgi:hypothetical protein
VGSVLCIRHRPQARLRLERPVEAPSGQTPAAAVAVAAGSPWAEDRA